MCCSWILLKGSRERRAHRRTERGDTSPGHQWGLALSLRYLRLLCFRASSIKYETLRQKEAEWKGRERGPQRAPLSAFEGATEMRSVVRIEHINTQTHISPTPPPQMNGWWSKYPHLHLLFFCFLFWSLVRIYHKRNTVGEIRPKSLG